MDGGRRFLRSITEQLGALLAPVLPRPAGAFGSAVSLHAFAPSQQAPRLREAPQERAEPPKRGALKRLAAFAALPGVGSFALMVLFGLTGFAGFTHNGDYDKLIAEGGAPQDIIARALGFPISAVTISGQARLLESEVLAAAHIDARNSLLFVDAADVRDRLMQLPLVKTARVLKLYPDRLVISIEEREPAALWQRDGKIAVVAADGKVIDELNDQRFLGLPFVVGEDADKRLPEYVSLLKDLGDLAARVKAGVFVAGRRWSLTMTNGVEVKLPERDPGAAVATLTRLQRDARILDKDIMSIDLRLPDRVPVRLTEEGVAARAAASPRKPVKSGGQT